MALAPGTACRWPGCPEVTRDPSGYCDSHRQQARRRWDKAHDAKRGSARQRLYNTEWEKFRHWFMQQPGNQTCHRCREQGRITLAVVVHHIKPLKDRPDLRLDPDNCQPLCRPCHEQLHGRGRGI